MSDLSQYTKEQWVAYFKEQGMPQDVAETLARAAKNEWKEK